MIQSNEIKKGGKLKLHSVVVTFKGATSSCGTRALVEWMERGQLKASWVQINQLRPIV